MQLPIKVPVLAVSSVGLYQIQDITTDMLISFQKSFNFTSVPLQQSSRLSSKLSSIFNEALFPRHSGSFPPSAPSPLPNRSFTREVPLGTPFHGFQQLISLNLGFLFSTQDPQSLQDCYSSTTFPVSPSQTWYIFVPVL